jgi:site-specific DNA-methyltransferase (adenine-specific)
MYYIEHSLGDDILTSINIYNEDCLSGIQKLNDNVVDFVITSPPYDDLRDYNGYTFDFDYFMKLSQELYRVLKVGGVIIWVVSDKTDDGSESGTSFKQALYFKEIGFKLYDTMIFAKKNYINKNHRRYEQAFEYMFVLSKGIPKSFNPIKVPCIHEGKPRSGTYRHEKNGKLKKLNTPGKVKSTKIKSNIWYYTVGKNCTKLKAAHTHMAIFPDQLVEDHIKSWTEENDLILDPFIGSGTVARICKILKRNFIGYEISTEYCNLANSLLKEICD